MLKKLFKDKKVRYRNLVLLIIPFVILIGLFSYMSLNSIMSILGMATGSSSQVVNSIESMDYHLRGNATDLQEELFKDLAKAVEKNEDGEKDLEVAELVVKNFIADFYTWSNKNGSFDIGGMYYVYSPSKTNIYNQARDEFYKYVSYYINEYGKENLLEIETIETEVIETNGTYTYGDKSYPSCFIKAEWTFVDKDGFDESDYLTKAYFTVIKNDAGRFEIVQTFGD